MIRAAVITVSDSAAAGVREDLSGPAVQKRAREFGWAIAHNSIVSDDRREIASTLSSLADLGEVDVILTTGGTGLAPRDVTPEAARQVADREAQGFGEMMRAEGRKSTKFASLSRGGAFTRGSVLIVTLPGSPRGAVESLEAVAELIPHAVNLLHGNTEHGKKPALD
ncbi:MAG TPA: MogA/MoaB family molybdenum cofactor biosynthesis protein [Bryobacteraceae bacterium]|nr:MogA/MoaB family molybdenum cofactor biosynthesis protein [Bryobacteraceae bacterium]